MRSSSRRSSLSSDDHSGAEVDSGRSSLVDLQPSQRVSRSGLVYGSSLLTTADPDGADMNRHRDLPGDVWYDMERFQMDHIAEVLSKLSENRLDDEIWGKVMVMERARRVAKAYLRKTTFIVDGSDEEFDGRTLGFNHFPNSMRDDYTLEIKSKIGDGVIIKMDYQGNIKAMARGSTPIFIQGWKDTRNNCMGQRLVRLQGRLKTSLGGGNEDEQVLKVFDMRRFKACLENETIDFQKEVKHLLMKTCVRVALVKDGGGTDPMKTPCWFMIINLVALDMLVTKVPELTSQGALASLYGGADKIPRFTSQTSILPPGSDIYTNPAALTQIIAAAVQQANNQSKPQIDVEQLAKLASTITVQQQPPPAFNRKSRKCRTFSDSDDSPESSTDLRSRGRSVCTMSSAASSSGVSGFSSHRREKPRGRPGKSIDAVYRLQETEQEEKEAEGKYARAPVRPRLTEDIFAPQKPPVPKHQTPSTTSDYDSQKEMESSGSWSSSKDLQRSSSPSIPSESDPEPPRPLQPSVIQVNHSEDVPRFFVHSLARGLSKPRATVPPRSSNTLPHPQAISRGTTVSVSRRDPGDYEENAVVIAKTSTSTCPDTPERTSTSTTESRIPPSRPSEALSPATLSRRTNLPVSQDTPTSAVPKEPTVPSTHVGNSSKGPKASIGRQLRQLWNSWTLRGGAETHSSKASWFGGLRRRPKCPLIPEQLYSPPSSTRCSANADRQLPAVPPDAPRRCAPLPTPQRPLGPSSCAPSGNGPFRSPASPRCGAPLGDFDAPRTPWTPRSGRGLRRCNDADLYGLHVAPVRPVPPPEEMLMY
ncbi:hypothetical protein QR680_017833 [Steinernema hermaphroditum]|uniref:MH2 domain-containing protein n=1 Tax=Steinernema hermaphroditum TaxID=289476 RepID=A0AA39HGY3_9BILA|nr:hypothetical protein QR680_017833 [Steinernema hermaphroditum]